MNWADWSIVFVIVVSALIGVKRGFIREALSLAVWVAAFLLANWFKEAVADLLVPWIDVVSIRQVLAFILIFIAVLALGGVVSYLMGKLTTMIGLKTVDRLFGALFGLARGALLIMVVVLYLPKIVPVRGDAWWHESVLIPYFIAMEDEFLELISIVYDVVIGLL